MKVSLSRAIIDRSRRFFKPHLDLVDAWRRDFLPLLLRSVARSDRLVITEIVRTGAKTRADLEASYQSFSRHLNSAQWDEQEAALRTSVQASLGRGARRLAPIAVDDGDLAKPYARKMEGLGRVRDGDKDTITNGYWMFESYFVDDQYAPIPLVNFAYGLEQDGTHSMQQARRRGYEAIVQASGCEVVVIEDRGFDGLDNFRDLQEVGLSWLVRSQGTRELLEPSGASLGIISDFVATWELQHVMSAPGKWQDGVELPKRVAYDFKEVQIPGLEGRFWLVAVRRCMAAAEGGMYLLTSVPLNKPADAEMMIRYYHRRWRAEDSIRFMKSELGVEGVRTLNFRPLRRLLMIASWIMALISFLRISLSDEQLRKLRDSVPFFDREEPRLLHYRIAYALRAILAKSGAT